MYLFAKSEFVIGQFPPAFVILFLKLVSAFLIDRTPIENDQWFVDSFYRGMSEKRACHWLCAGAVPCLCLHLVGASAATGSDCLVMSSSGAEDKPRQLIVKSQTPSFSQLFKIAIYERG